MQMVTVKMLAGFLLLKNDLSSDKIQNTVYFLLFVCVIHILFYELAL